VRRSHDDRIAEVRRDGCCVVLTLGDVAVGNGHACAPRDVEESRFVDRIGPARRWPERTADHVGELVAYGKANPGKLNYASAGEGSLIHLATELFKAAAGINATHVPYKGMGAAYPDLIAGQVQMAFASIVSALPHARTQRLRALAVSGPARAQAQPDLPTVAEAGIKGYEVSQWYAVFAPARVPQAVVDRLNREIVGALQNAEVAKRLAFDGAEPVGGSPAQLKALLVSDLAKWARVIKETGIRGD